MNPSSHCSYCPAVKRVCFWGELTTYAPWKRAFVLAASALCAIGLSIVLWLTWDRPNVWMLWMVAVPSFAIMCLGLVVAIAGCNSCVVRMSGDV